MGVEWELELTFGFTTQSVMLTCGSKFASRVERTNMELAEGIEGPNSSVPR